MATNTILYIKVSCELRLWQYIHQVFLCKNLKSPSYHQLREVALSTGGVYYNREGGGDVIFKILNFVLERATFFLLRSNGGSHLFQGYFP